MFDSGASPLFLALPAHSGGNLQDAGDARRFSTW